MTNNHKDIIKELFEDCSIHKTYKSAKGLITPIDPDFLKDNIIKAIYSIIELEIDQARADERLKVLEEVIKSLNSISGHFQNDKFLWNIIKDKIEKLKSKP